MYAPTGGPITCRIRSSSWMWWNRCPPESARIFFQETSSAGSPHPVRAPCATTSSPIAPCAIRRFACRTPAMKFVTCPAKNNRRASRAASTISRHSAYASATGFSQNTCLPAASAGSTASACAWLGDATTTTSTSPPVTTSPSVSPTRAPTSSAMPVALAGSGS